MRLNQFPGWVEIGPEGVVKKGDVVFRASGEDDWGGRFDDPNKTKPAGGLYAGSKARHVLGSHYGRLIIVRRVGPLIRSNPYAAKPAPLP